MTKSPKRSARARAKDVQSQSDKKVDITPDEFFKAWSRKDREALIEVLIDTLDAEAGDADLEPSLGFLEPEITRNGGHSKWPYYSDDARQDVSQGSTCDGESDDGDDEPSLGSVEDHPNPYRDGTDYPGYGRDQRRWAAGNADDREGDEHDGREPDHDEGGESEKEDDEPSLGWTDREVAFGSYPDVNGCCDLEEDAGDMRESDPAEHGIADRDGILEQFGHDPRYGTFYPGAAAI